MTYESLQSGHDKDLRNYNGAVYILNKFKRNISYGRYAG